MGIYEYQYTLILSLEEGWDDVHENAKSGQPKTQRTDANMDSLHSDQRLMFVFGLAYQPLLVI